MYILEPRGARKTRRRQWTDPDTGKVVVRSLTLAEEANTRTPHPAAKSKYLDIERRKKELANGAARYLAGGVSIEHAFDRYFIIAPKPGEKIGLGALRSLGTRTEYRRASDNFVAWCLANEIRTVGQLTAERLHEYAPQLVLAPKKVPRKGGKRNERDPSQVTRSAFTSNKELRGLKTVLRWLSKIGVVKIALSDITDALKQTTARANKDPFLPAQLAQILDACKRHDAATFKLDRRRRTDTTRYKPVYALVWFVLMTGIRIEELWVTPG